MIALFYFFTFLLVGALHIAFSSVAPYPLNTINVSILLIAFMVITRRFRLALFTAMLMGILMELYAVTPFGILLGSMVTSVSAGLLLATTLLSTLQLLGGALLIAAMTAIFRAAFISLTWAASIWSSLQMPSARSALQSGLTAILLTSLAGAAIIGLYALLSRKSRITSRSLHLPDL